MAAQVLATSRRDLKQRRLLALALAGVSALMAAQWMQELQPQCFAGATVKKVQVVPRARGVARAAEEEPAEGGEEEEAPKVKFVGKIPRRKYKGSAKCKTYDDYVYLRPTREKMRIRLDKWGKRHKIFFRMMASSARKMTRVRNTKSIERVGWWDPLLEVDHPEFFSVRCDRVCYYLRKGAQPTDMVASLLDRAGIIRRTGRNAKLGDWEWRVPRSSGPEAPEGWKYDGPHMVTWNNRPQRKWPVRQKRPSGIPLIEKYGFVGYQKIPMDQEVVDEPLTDSGLTKAYDNIMLPGFDQARLFD